MKELLETLRERHLVEPHRPGGRKQFPSAKVIIHEQPETQQPGRTQILVVWQDETERPGDVRCHVPENFPLLQRFSNQVELVIFKVAQSAVDQLG